MPHCSEGNAGRSPPEDELNAAFAHLPDSDDEPLLLSAVAANMRATPR